MWVLGGGRVAVFWARRGVGWGRAPSSGRGRNVSMGPARKPEKAVGRGTSPKSAAQALASCNKRMAACVGSVGMCRWGGVEGNQEGSVGPGGPRTFWEAEEVLEQHMMLWRGGEAPYLSIAFPCDAKALEATHYATRCIQEAGESTGGSQPKGTRSVDAQVETYSGGPPSVGGPWQSPKEFSPTTSSFALAPKQKLDWKSKQ